MPAKIVAIKEKGTNPPTDGILATVARIHSIASLSDLKLLAVESPEVVLVDVSMPHLDAKAVMNALMKSSKRKPLVMVFDSSQGPSRLRGQLNQLLRTKTGQKPGPSTIAQAARLLGASQESLARMLNVSSRTVHRWLKGARPAPKAELDKLRRIAMRLKETFPNEHSIRSYLHYPNPSFDGETPFALLLRGDFERIEADLLAIQEGVFV